MFSIIVAIVTQRSTNAAATAPLVVATQSSTGAAHVQAQQEVPLGHGVVAAPATQRGSAIDTGTGDDVLRLRARGLTLPVSTVSASQLVDTYYQARAGGASHKALDIMAPRGTPVVAVEDGRVVKQFSSKAGGITLYQFDPGGEYVYYYAHLDRYAEHLSEGDSVYKGQVIGYVGSTGNASPDAPHLHFAVSRLDSARQWWRGTSINPFLLWRNAKR
ncbi:MAG: M23 family metallopeptidase [Pseudoxanthomonas sp.]